MLQVSLGFLSEEGRARTTLPDILWSVRHQEWWRYIYLEQRLYIDTECDGTN